MYFVRKKDPQMGYVNLDVIQEIYTAGLNYKTEDGENVSLRGATGWEDQAYVEFGTFENEAAAWEWAHKNLPLNMEELIKKVSSQGG